jgi:hypothetical protein
MLQGPLAWALIVWRCSLVFNSVDKIISVLIHLLPGMLCLQLLTFLSSFLFNLIINFWKTIGFHYDLRRYMHLMYFTCVCSSCSIFMVFLLKVHSILEWYLAFALS